MTKRVIFRSDGNSEIGLGHIIRSLALVDIISPEFVCVFASRFIDEFISKEISTRGIKFIKLSSEDDSHFDEFLMCLKSTDIVVLDNYFYTTEYQVAIKQLGCTLVCIDDMCDRHFVADAVINHSPTATADKYSKEKYTKLYLGLGYALLRKEFFNISKRSRSCHKRKALVCLGGADKYDITSKLVSLISNEKSVSSIDVVISSSYQNKNQLIKTIERTSKEVGLYSNLSAFEMSLKMQNCDFGVFPASTICLEAMYVGLPFLVGYTVENHRELYDTLIHKYNVQGLGSFLDLTSLPTLHPTLPSLELLDSTSNLLSVFEEYA